MQVPAGVIASTISAHDSTPPEIIELSSVASPLFCFFYEYGQQVSVASYLTSALIMLRAYSEGRISYTAVIYIDIALAALIIIVMGLRSKIIKSIKRSLNFVASHWQYNITDLDFELRAFVDTWGHRFEQNYFDIQYTDGNGRSATHSLEYPYGISTDTSQSNKSWVTFPRAYYELKITSFVRHASDFALVHRQNEHERLGLLADILNKVPEACLTET